MVGVRHQAMLGGAVVNLEFGRVAKLPGTRSLKLESGEIQEEGAETHLTKGTRAEAGFGGLPALLAEETNGWLGYH